MGDGLGGRGGGGAAVRGGMGRAAVQARARRQAEGSLIQGLRAAPLVAAGRGRSGGVLPEREHTPTHVPLPSRGPPPTLVPRPSSGNAIDVKGAEALADALAANATLTRLCLSDNYLGEAGARALAGALSQNGSVKELQLRGNELGDEGLRLIADALMVGGGRGARVGGRCRAGAGPWGAPGARGLAGVGCGVEQRRRPPLARMPGRRRLPPAPRTPAGPRGADRGAGRRQQQPDGCVCARARQAAVQQGQPEGRQRVHERAGQRRDAGPGGRAAGVKVGRGRGRWGGGPWAGRCRACVCGGGGGEGGRAGEGPAWRAPACARPLPPSLHNLMRPPPPTPPAAAAAAPRALHTLDVGGNDIGPEGAKALAEALAGHPALKSLELGYNPLGPTGAETVAGAFKFNTKVWTGGRGLGVWGGSRGCAP